MAALVTAREGRSVAAFVADNDKNDLLVCTSLDGIHWSDNHLVRSGNWNVRRAGSYEERTELRVTYLFLRGRIRCPGPRERRIPDCSLRMEALGAAGLDLPSIRQRFCR